MKQDRRTERYIEEMKDINIEEMKDIKRGISHSLLYEFNLLPRFLSFQIQVPILTSSVQSLTPLLNASSPLFSCFAKKQFQACETTRNNTTIRENIFLPLSIFHPSFSCVNTPPTLHPSSLLVSANVCRCNDQLSFPLLSE